MTIPVAPSAAAPPVLPPGALDVLNDLPHGRVADVQIGAAFEVMRLDFEMYIHRDLRSLMLMAIVART